jgi:hypothetical protein
MQLELVMALLGALKKLPATSQGQREEQDQGEGGGQGTAAAAEPCSLQLEVCCGLTSPLDWLDGGIDCLAVVPPPTAPHRLLCIASLHTLTACTSLSSLLFPSLHFSSLSSPSSPFLCFVHGWLAAADEVLGQPAACPADGERALLLVESGVRLAGHE